MTVILNINYNTSCVLQGTHFLSWWIDLIFWFTKKEECIFSIDEKPRFNHRKQSSCPGIPFFIDIKILFQAKHYLKEFQSGYKSIKTWRYF